MHLMPNGSARGAGGGKGDKGGVQQKGCLPAAVTHHFSCHIKNA